MLQNIYNRFRRITTNQLYFPEIDGIRFIAISLVILFHVHGYFTGKTDFKGVQYYWLDTFLMNGDRGVELFFVLSGFILCLPFAHHYINGGKKVKLKKYYLRRVTRLEPPYFIAMTAILLMQLLVHAAPTTTLTYHGQPVSWIQSWLASLVYAHNFVFRHAPLLTVVAWSLEIEIQFYLLAPLLFRILSLNKVPRRAILVTGIIASIVCQQLYPLPKDIENLYAFIQYFLAGILLSDFYVSDTASSFFNRKWLVLPSFITLIVIVYLPIKKEPLPTETIFLSRLVLPFLIGLFYYSVLKNDVLKRIFSYKFIPIIGGMCYSIYLLHYTIISMLGRLTLHVHFTSAYIPNLMLQIILLVIPVLVISSVFYLYIERPFMSAKWLDLIMKKDLKHEQAVMEAEQAKNG